MLPPTGASRPGDGKYCLLVAGSIGLSAGNNFFFIWVQRFTWGVTLPGIIDPDLTGKTHLILYTYT